MMTHCRMYCTLYCTVNSALNDDTLFVGVEPLVCFSKKPFHWLDWKFQIVIIYVNAVVYIRIYTYLSFEIYTYNML